MSQFHVCEYGPNPYGDMCYIQRVSVSTLESAQEVVRLILLARPKADCIIVHKAKRMNLK